MDATPPLPHVYKEAACDRCLEIKTCAVIGLFLASGRKLACLCAQCLKLALNAVERETEE